MRWIMQGLAVLGLAIAAGSAGAQQAPAAAGSAPPYKLLRYDEDYRYLQDPGLRSDFWDPIKYIPLGPENSYLSLGGEARERYEGYTAANFGVPGKTADSYLLHRILVHADLHAGAYARGFVQLGNQLSPGKNAAAPPYLDRLDVQQAFVDVRLPLTDDAKSEPYLRIGRQEIEFGLQRVVSIRDAPNVRRSFDGIRLWGTVEQVRVDAFATWPTLVKPNTFDDQPNHAQGFWGLYAAIPKSAIPDSGLDLYYLGFENSNARYSVGAAVEVRHSIGGRVFGRARRWDWDWEGLAQFGSFGPQDIRAWGFSGDTGYSFTVNEWKARGGLKATAGSGDRDPLDGKLGTYNGLFPKLAYFNQAGLLGASNVLDLQPSLTLRPTDSVKITTA